jgi:hypothetical protein
MLNFFYGFLLGLGLKLSLICVSYALDLINIYAPIASILNSLNAGVIIENYLGILTITTSVLVCLFYIKITPSYLKNSNQRRIPNRIVALCLSWVVINTLATLCGGNPTTSKASISPSFLWMLDIFYPDTVGHLWGFPINLLALVCILIYIPYAIMLGRKRKSISTTLHVTAAITFFFLSYNGPAAFYLFWVIQNISLLIQVKRLGIIIEPQK